MICERTADADILTAQTLEDAIGAEDGLHREIGSLVRLKVVEVVNDDYPSEQIHLLDLSDRYVGDFWEQVRYACAKLGVSVSVVTEQLDLSVLKDDPPGIGYGRI